MRRACRGVSVEIPRSRFVSAGESQEHTFSSLENLLHHYNVRHGLLESVKGSGARKGAPSEGVHCWVGFTEGIDHKIFAVVPRPSRFAGPQRARTGSPTAAELGRICAPK